MDILNIEKLNNNQKKKKKKTNDDDDDEQKGCDRINELPDEILVHVLSLVPLRTAAATSVVSRRWIHLWEQVPNLNFDDLGPYTQLTHLFAMPPGHHCPYIPAYQVERSQFCMRKYIDWVNSVIESYDKSHSYPLQEFSMVALVDKPNHHQAIKWLEFALSRRVEKLKLISNEYWFSACVLADMLKGISISSGFTSLKLLWLKSFRTSGDAIELLLRCCPMLETLVLDTLRVTTDLEVVASSMKHLDIRCAEYCADPIRVRAPALTWLTVDHYAMIVSLENVPKLVNMAIHCYKNMLHAVRDFAAVARQLETLIIFLTYPEEVTFSVPEMPNLKKLVVYYRSRSWRSEDLFPVTRFMRAAPALEDFRIDVVELGVRTNVFRIPEDDNEHRHLRRFVLSGFCWDHIHLLRYVVNCCTALEEIVVGQCNRQGLVRDFVDYCVPLRHLIPPTPTYKYYVATPQERQEINKRVRLFTPSHINLRVV